MRLRRLDLVRYGKFTDFSLDLGPAEPGRADLHVIFGPNEAGKSTAFNGYLDLLYGIPERTPYSFLHGSALRVSALLETPDRSLVLTRVKKRGSDLLDGDDQPADPQGLAAILHGLDQDSYKHMFFLDDDTLERGGEAILNSEGDVGRLLFSAAAGLGDLAKTVEDLGRKADDFHKPRARSGELRELKGRLEDLRKERKTQDVEASAFEALRRARDDAATQFDKAAKVFLDCSRERDRLKGLEAALADADLLSGVQTRLEGLTAYPPVPKAWTEEVRALDVALKTATNLERQALEEMDRQDAALAALERDTECLAQEHVIAAATAAEAQALAARTALSDLRADLDGAKADIIRLVDRLGGAPDLDPRTVLVGEEILEALANLAADHDRLVTAEETARAEREGAEAALREARSVADEVGPPEAQAQAQGEGPGSLIERLRARDPESALRHAAAALEEARARLEPALRALAPWTGTAEDLSACPVPTKAQAARWRDRVLALRKDSEALERDITRHTDEWARLEAAVDATTKAMPDLGDGAAEDARSARDAAWTAHKATLDPDTAAAFEAAMGRHDRIAEARLAGSEALARLREDGRKRAETGAALDRLKARRETFHAELGDLAGEMRSALEAAGLPHAFDAEDLPAWLERHGTAQSLAAEAAAAQAAHQRARASLEESNALLRAAVDGEASARDPGPDDDASVRAAFVTLMARAEAMDKAATLRQEKARHAAEGLRKAKSDLEARRRAHGDAATALSTWQEAWTRHIEGCWLEGRAPRLVARQVPVIRDLRHAVDQRERCAAQISAREADVRHFADRVAALMAALGEADAGDPYATLKALERRLDAAREAERRAADHGERRAELEEQARKAGRDAAEARERVAVMAAHFPAQADVETVDDLQQAIDQAAERGRLEREVEDLGRRVAKALDGQDADEARAILERTDRADLADRIRAADCAVEDAQQERDRRLGERRDAVRALEAVGGDDRAARLEEARRVVLLEIEDKAERALRLRLGLMLAERALARYRDLHRSTMLAHTAQAFRTMTGGAFEDLATHPGERNRETLIARRAGGGASIEVGNMSKGTRFQLYLALRLAGYRRFCETAGPLPFIADDIMETFDDARAAEAFGLLKEIGRVGQAIYFTHHDHLCAIARDVCGPDVRIHSLVSSAP
ncbi:MAG: AAA family ATPase [Alphaproteobacteria bacterium]